MGNTSLYQTHNIKPFGFMQPTAGMDKVGKREKERERWYYINVALRGISFELTKYSMI